MERPRFPFPEPANQLIRGALRFTNFDVMDEIPVVLLAAKACFDAGFLCVAKDTPEILMNPLIPTRDKISGIALVGGIFAWTYWMNSAIRRAVR